MYNNDQIQEMITVCHNDPDRKKAVLSQIKDQRDRDSVRYVINDGYYEAFDRFDSDVCEQFLTAYETVYERLCRYDGTLGPNTKQWWIYDNELDCYCDPPTEVLERVTAINNGDTADELDAQRSALEYEAVLGDWVNDEEYMYSDVEI